MWRCKAAVDEEDPRRRGYMLETLPAGERIPGSVGAVPITPARDHDLSITGDVRSHILFV